MSDPNTKNEQEAPFTEEKVIVVDPGQVPVRIDKFLVDKTMRISRSRIQEGVKTGSVTVNGETVKSNYKVNPGDEIKLMIPRQMEVGSTLLPQEIPLDVVYEDADLLVINKAAGMVVHPGIGNYDG